MEQLPNHSKCYLSTGSSSGAFRFLLFVDQRSYPKDIIQEVTIYIEQIKQDYFCELEIVDLKDQPHLVEHYKLIVTPALVKIYPLPEQILMGSNLKDQLEKWFPHWKNALEGDQQKCLHFEQTTDYVTITHPCDQISVVGSSELLRLSDEIFLLKQEKESLLEQIKFKDQMLAMIAHDLRNPLTAVSMAFDTLVHADALQHFTDNQKADFKTRIYQQAKFQIKLINQMIGDLLDATRNLQGKLNINPQALDLKVLASEIIEQFTSKLTIKNQALTIDIPQDLPLVYVDQELIRQVILNLLDNAVKYTPKEGKITFAILHRTSQKVQITVTDTGLGIPPEKKEEIFERNVRLERDLSQEGYGLGLSLCRKIIQAHYGQIWVDSVPHQGSSFHFTLPIYYK